MLHYVNRDCDSDSTVSFLVKFKANSWIFELVAYNEFIFPTERIFRRRDTEKNNTE